MESGPESSSTVPQNVRRHGLTEDWTAALVGLSILGLGLVAAWFVRPANLTWETSADQVADVSWKGPTAGLIGKPGSWDDQPLDAFRAKASPGADGIEEARPFELKPLLGAFVATFIVGVIAIVLRGAGAGAFGKAFPLLFLLATFAYLLAGQSVIKNYNLEYALWALLVGLVISNTWGTPRWLRPAVMGELYIKIGLVLLGAEVLFGRLVALGVPGIFVSWVVTPIVLVSTYIFGQRVLKLSSKSLNMVISADMSVCGVSAAIATAAACRAKKEELSLAVGLSLSFTVLMMIVMPRVVTAIGLDPVVGGAWIGGTIDATGAVAAAGEALGEIGSETAVTVKMIQNILIGVIAFCVAVYWTRWVETDEANGEAGSPSVGAGEIWRRFPKFVLGFIAASVLCSLLFAANYLGERWVSAVTKDLTKPLRGWMFCLAFVCIGLDTNFRQLLPYFRTGKPMVLYVCGQALNIVLTLAMAYIMFGVVFKSQ